MLEFPLLYGHEANDVPTFWLLLYSIPQGSLTLNPKPLSQLY